MTDAPSPTATHSDDLPLSRIQIDEAFNPRRYFSESALADLTESIARQGVLQTLLVRPSPDSEGDYLVVAGERRYRAAQRAGLTTVPARIAVLTDAEALAAATAENGQREDISVAEEARLARRALSLNDGSKDDAARMLGWKRSRLEARLMLLHATDKVLDALEQRTIRIGHAELLATLPPVTQDGTLRKILDEDYTVAYLKDRLGQFTRELAQARFDTTECQGCPFNSATQASLFEFTVGAGRCSNRECWSDKTKAHIDAVIAEQQQNVPAVYRDTDRDESTRTILFAEGANGVGADQYAACQSCQFYGVVVSTEPGREGAVTSDVCFNVACNKEKIAAAAKARDDAATADAKVPDARAGSGASAGSAKGSKVAPSGGAQGRAKATVAKTPQAVTALADKAVRSQAVAEHQKTSVVQDALSLFTMFLVADTTGSQHVKDAISRCAVAGMSASAPDHRLFEGLLAASEDDRAAMRNLLSIHLLGQRTGSSLYGYVDWQTMAKGLVSSRQPDLSETFTLDREFLRAHTKSGMASLLKEAGFDQWYDAREGEGAFKKLVKQKIDVIVERVFPKDGRGFDFAGFVPESVRKQAGVSKIS